MYPIFRPLLNKGGAGRSLSRQDTVEAINPLIEHHARLITVYHRAIGALADRELAAAIEPVMNRNRTEYAKLRETVLACGGVPPSGIGLRDEQFDLGGNDGEILNNLEHAERDYRQALEDALAYPHHQIRTIAILENNLTGSNERLDVLGPLAERNPRAMRRGEVPRDRVTTIAADLEPTVQHDDSDEQPAARRAERSEERD